MNNEIITLVIPYAEGFRKAINAGWGCGYVLIPIELEICKTFDREGKFYGATVPDFSEEITYNEVEKIGGKKYLKIGFDTAHTYNNMGNSGFDFVMKKTIELLEAVKTFQPCKQKKKLTAQLH